MAVPFGMCWPVRGLTAALTSRPRLWSMSRLTAPSTAGRITVSARNPLSEAMTATYRRIRVISWEPQPCGLGGFIACGGGMCTDCGATASMSAAYIW